jgi:transmembrane sensor
MSYDNCEQDPVDPHLHEAARWLVDLQDPNLSPEELLRWNKWQQSAANREAFDSLASLWDAIHSAAKDINSAAESTARLAPVVELRRGPSRSVQLPNSHVDSAPAAANHERTRSFKWIAAAASLVVAASLTFVALDQTNREQVITTGASQWHHMNLTDGTAVHVDAHSKVEVEYTEQERIVHVHAGSAVFDVAKDPMRPFIARTHVVDAVAVGTRFGVSIDSVVTTTVSEGSVKVTARGKVGGVARMLKAGEELRVSATGLAPPQVTHVDAERKLQWANGLLFLGGMTVAEGVAELNRRNRTQIVVESPKLGAQVLEVASVSVDAPETYAKMVAEEQGVTLRVDKKNDVIRLSE